MDRFFKISERGSSVSTEVTGGLTTFLTMSYIIAVNPSILVAAGIPFSAALTSTCIGTAIVTALMGLVANRPVALSTGMGLNAIVAFTFCGGLGVDWRIAMAIVMLQGLLILVLVLVGVRKAIMDAIPSSLQYAIGIGIGLFLALLGLKGGQIVVADESNLIALGDLTSPTCIVALVSLAIAAACEARKIKGGLIVSIIAAVVIGIPLGVTAVPAELSFGLDFSAFFAPFQAVPGTDTMALVAAVTQPVLLAAVFSFMMADFFDTMGGVVAIGRRAGFTDDNGTVEDAQKILAVDSFGAAFGGAVGASSITAFIESAAGAAAGARTGLSNLVVAALFVVFAFLSPIIGMVSSAATAGALMVVGYLMLRDVAHIDWSKVELAFPAFLTIACIPLTNSITDGIGFGFIAYCLVMAVQGRAREVKPLMWIVSAAFLLLFIFG